MVITRTFEIRTNGSMEITDITGQIERLVRNGEVLDGVVTIFIPGSSVAVTTIVCEEGQRGRLPDSFERLNILGQEPEDIQLKAALVGTSLMLPFSQKKLPLSLWQQIVLVDFGHKPDWHMVTVQLAGDGKEEDKKDKK